MGGEARQDSGEGWSQVRTMRQVLFGLTALVVLVSEVGAQRPGDTPRRAGVWVNHRPVPAGVIDALLDLSNWKKGVHSSRRHNVSVNCGQVVKNTLASLANDTWREADRVGEDPSIPPLAGEIFHNTNQAFVRRDLSDWQKRMVIIHEAEHSAGVESGPAYQSRSHPHANAAGECLDYRYRDAGDPIPWWRTRRGSGLAPGEYVSNLVSIGGGSSIATIITVSSPGFFTGKVKIGEIEVECADDPVDDTWPRCSDLGDNR